MSRFDISFALALARVFVFVASVLAFVVSVWAGYKISRKYTDSTPKEEVRREYVR